jgi:hypothetical protein
LVGEVLWNRDYTKEAVQAGRDWMTLVEAARQTELGHLQSKARDVRALRQLARAMHRDQDPGAWQLISAAHRILCNEAGSWEQLSRLASTSPFHGLGDLYSQLLGIAVPAARRRPTTEHAMVDLFLGDAISVVKRIPLASTDDYTKYHAVVAMTLQSVCARKDPERDGDLVNLLWKLDGVTRPRNARGAVTRFVVSSTIAEYFGDFEAARVYRRHAAEALSLAKMDRHCRVLETQYPVTPAVTKRDALRRPA